MERITISSSLKHKEIIKGVIATLEKVGVTALFPNPDSGGVAKEDVDLELMKRLEADHFEEIDNGEALYIICPEGKVGTLVAVEIGYAKAKNKPIIFSERPVDLGLQALASGYISLEKITRLKTI
ncbi:MAG: hypothetical protein Q8Q24_01975 [bacterium]|nr:hypothetical protein [bacterium]